MVRLVGFLVICLLACGISSCSPRWYVVVSGDASAVVDPASGRRAASLSIRITSGASLDSIGRESRDGESFRYVICK